MPVAFVYSLISIGLCLIIRRHGGWTWILVWPALSFLLVCIAYALTEPRMLGKRADGTLTSWSALLLFPFHVAILAKWRIVLLFHRLHSPEPRASQISPTLWVGRRLKRRAVPPGVTCIVDMTCEFAATRGLVQSVAHYHCLPTLDYGMPPPGEALDLLEKLRSYRGGILIHCAQGHGRSALLAAAYLVATHAARTPDEAVQAIKLKRPTIRFTPKQRAALDAIAHLSSNSPDIDIGPGRGLS